MKPILLPWIFSQSHRQALQQQPWRAARARCFGPCIWVHASSVGELECLVPLIFAWGQQKKRLVITIWSESAASSLERLRKTLEAQSVEVLWSGYAPWEGEWLQALDYFHPDWMITTKYEAWPDLWLSLHEKKIPLGIISAQKRASLGLARAFCAQQLPELWLFTTCEEHRLALQAWFPDAWIQVIGEPRWDQVACRAQQGQPPRIHIFKNQAQGFARPWGVIGSAWLEDVQFLCLSLKSQPYTGTWWIVPHCLEPRLLKQIRYVLEQSHLRVLSTSTWNGVLEEAWDDRKTCLLVDEMGFLLELYALADWAYVGGGWGAGIHSTIEPAFYGIPIGVGPQGVQNFDETRVLSECGQLSVLRSQEQLLFWRASVLATSKDQKRKWQVHAQQQQGASLKILSAISKKMEQNQNAVSRSV